ncbi:UDP-glucose dehydrogenase family protein [Brachybacterium squillarum]|uniref:UDP-glucose dehydrogenase family protein n=1 Tax=Brachybacterium squillarum TaxID=661979 RepID=UPI00222151D9|nr:UDP-glucose/GDP-mannose dehydrogenase family protein [Brachybacterium squillarum]MCW1805151.1 UDP-glucose/GDP-mannose dehydrogenase family protein [Brachybacterium squillarum]
MTAAQPASVLTLSVIGVGYLGAVHAAAMAELGHQVIGLDIDAERIASLNEGRAPFHEPGFEEVLRRNVDAGRLRFTTDYADLADADVHFLALGTPQRADGLGADLSYIESALDALVPLLKARGGKPTLIAGKSTVPVGTARELHARITTIDGVALAWNPEFLREGFAVEDTLRPDRLVYGVADQGNASAEISLLDAVYAELIDLDIPRKVYNFESAELVKVSANSFLATKISFINAISELCDVTGADVTDVAEAIGMDDRIGSKFLRAGIGFGGGCLPKDIRGLLSRAGELGAVDSFAFLRDIDAINTGRREYVVRLAKRLLDGTLDGKRVAVLGAAFKPDTDDVRDSPALDIALKLYSEGAKVSITDPAANENVRRRYPSFHVEDSVEDTLRDAELVLLLTEWKEYRELDPASVLDLVATAQIIDGRNALDLAAWRAAGWQVEALGRP